MATDFADDIFLRQETHVFYGRGTRHIEDRDWVLLSEDEQHRCRRLRHHRDRACFAGARAALRRTLASYLAVDPRDVRFGRGPCPGCGSSEHGPPSVERPTTSLTFSFSRSEGRYLAAVAAGSPVGVDLESVREIKVSEMLDVSLTAGERAYLVAQPPSQWSAVFLRCWVRKEAVLKGAGLGLAGAAELRDIDVDPSVAAARVEVRARKADRPHWRVVDLPVRDDVSAALARPADVSGRILLSVDGAVVTSLGDD